MKLNLSPAAVNKNNHRLNYSISFSLSNRIVLDDYLSLLDENVSRHRL